MQTRDPDPGWKTWIIFLRAEKPFFWLKYLNSLICIREPGHRMEKIQIRDHGIQDEKNLDPVSWIWDGKHSDSEFRIRDKHPRSAKLEISSPNLLGLKEPNNNLTLCGKGILG
jgi:hypothetical protein